MTSLHKFIVHESRKAYFEIKLNLTNSRKRLLWLIVRESKSSKTGFSPDRACMIGIRGEVLSYIGYTVCAAGTCMVFKPFTLG